MNTDNKVDPSSPPVSKRKLNRNILRAVLFLMIGAQLSFSYVNCSGFGPANVAATTDPISGLCVVNAAVHTALESYDVNKVCGDASHYVCEQQVETLSSGSQQTAFEKCGNVAGLGYVCMNLDVTTTGAVNDPSNSHVAQAQAHCANTDVAAPGGYVLQANAATWDVALANVVNKCKIRSL